MKNKYLVTIVCTKPLNYYSYLSLFHNSLSLSLSLFSISLFHCLCVFLLHLSHSLYTISFFHNHSSFFSVFFFHYLTSPSPFTLSSLSLQPLHVSLTIFSSILIPVSSLLSVSPSLIPSLSPSLFCLLLFCLSQYLFSLSLTSVCFFNTISLLLHLFLSYLLLSSPLLNVLTLPSLPLSIFTTFSLFLSIYLHYLPFLSISHHCHLSHSLHFVCTTSLSQPLFIQNLPSFTFSPPLFHHPLSHSSILPFNIFSQSFSTSLSLALISYIRTHISYLHIYFILKSQ